MGRICNEREAAAEFENGALQMAVALRMWQLAHKEEFIVNTRTKDFSSDGSEQDGGSKQNACFE